MGNLFYLNRGEKIPEILKVEFENTCGCDEDIDKLECEASYELVKTSLINGDVTVELVEQGVVTDTSYFQNLYEYIEECWFGNVEVFEYYTEIITNPKDLIVYKLYV